MNKLADEEKTIAEPRVFSRKQIVAAVIFAALAAGLAMVVPSVQIAWVGAILVLTIYLFAFEVVGVDVAAANVMVLLGLTSLLAPYMGLEQGLVDNRNLFDGFASNAVISIIAVITIGAGLDRTGIMGQVAAFILKIGGTTETRIIPIISATVGFISSFMQNVGAAALFLPVVAHISARSRLPMSRLLMPISFTAILGGTMTMVGSSPLILLNDLILTSNKALPAGQQMETWGLFSVTPVGLALIITGIAYFVIAGRFVLLKTQSESSSVGSDPMAYFHDVYGVDYAIHEVVVTDDSDLVDKRLDDVESSYRVRVIAAKRSGEAARVGRGTLARDTELQVGMVLGVVADPRDLDHFVEKYHLKKRSEFRTFSESLAAPKSGIAEVVIPPGSGLISKSARDVWMRKTYGLAMIGLHREGETLREGDNIRAMPFKAGDTLVVHTAWNALERVEKDRNFVVVTTEYPREEQLRPHKILPAGIFFGIALIMGPAGYRVADFMKAGGIMTVLFLVVMMVMMNLVF